MLLNRTSQLQIGEATTTPVLRVAIQSLVIIGLLLFATSLRAQATVQRIKQFDITIKPADQALIEFAKQADISVLFSHELVKKHRANTIKGYLSIESAIRRLLEGSGLEANISQDGQITIDKASSSTKLIPSINTKNNETAEKSREILVEKVLVVGSRITGRTAEDLPVVVDIFDHHAISGSGQLELATIIQSLAPSFNLPSSSISDGTDSIKPATLRGLGPDQTLVLINGKRRHQTGLIHINTTVGRGSTGTDLNAIPIAAVERIEILRDGAAAQYGSDAIAGVINIVLKQNANELFLAHGKYSQGDGITNELSILKSFEIGSSGILQLAANHLNKGYTNHSGLHGSCQFAGCQQLNNGNYLMSDPREAEVSRQTFRIGEAESEHMAAVLNGKYAIPIGEFYGFATYSKRDSQSATFYRYNNQPELNPKLQDQDATIPLGFLPKINAEIEDTSINLGYLLETNSGSLLDLSYTNGWNRIDYITSDSINASFANALRYEQELDPDLIRQTIPRQAFAYGLTLRLETLNMDFSHDFEQSSIAFGFEYRKDNYRITPGELYSYKDYDSVAGEFAFENTTTNYVDATAGIQGFPGISPSSRVNEDRNVSSVYVDSEVAITSNFQLNTAVRYDNYDGFGDTLNYKLAGQFAISDQVKLRGAINSGFRAPSMQQLYFNNISTQFVADRQGNFIPQQVGTFRNDSELAQAIGIPELKEEESVNYSFGTSISHNDNFLLTIDYYNIEINDRIVLSNRIDLGLSDTLDSALNQVNAGQGQFFLNGINTKTKGVDIVASWRTKLLANPLDITFASNVTNTDVTDLFTPVSSGLNSVKVEQVFTNQDISIIEEWIPESKASISFYYQAKAWNMNFAINRYGEYTIVDGGKQTFGAENLLDLKLTYKLTKALTFEASINNLLDNKPDRNLIGNAHAGTIVDDQGNVIVSSSGVFTYSRRSAPFGFNGRFMYAGIRWAL